MQIKKDYCRPSDEFDEILCKISKNSRYRRRIKNTKSPLNKICTEYMLSLCSGCSDHDKLVGGCVGAGAYGQYVAGGEFLSFCEYMRRGCILSFYLPLKAL